MIRYTLRPAVDGDKAWLEQLRRAAYRDLFDATWGGWDESRHQRHFAEFWATGNISVIGFEDRRIGVLQLTETSDVFEVGEIQVHPEMQKRGVGRQVLTDVIQSATRLRKPVSLSLGLKNHGALRLYQRLGFEETARSDTHIFMAHRAGSD